MFHRLPAVAIATAFLLCACSAEKRSEFRAEATLQSKYTELVTPGTGPYLGADGVYSMSFRGDEYFLFSDTLFGDVQSGNVKRGAEFARNSIARITYDGLEFHSTPGEAWIKPKNAGEWIWFGMPWVSSNQQTLHLFSYRMTRRGNPDLGAFDFKQVGCQVVTFRGSLDNPVDWRELDACQTETGPTLSWGAWAITIDRHVYIYGVKDSQPKELFVARSSITDFEDDPTTNWTYWTGTTWSTSLYDGRPILTRVSNEMGVVKLADGRLAMVFQLDGMSPDVAVSYAMDPAGPWSPPKAIYRSPEAEADDQVFAYNAKPHPALGNSKEIVISYNVNTSKYFENFDRMHEIYYPRFLTWKPAFSK